MTLVLVDGSLHVLGRAHAARLARMLHRVDASIRPKETDIPGWRFHPLEGDRAGHCAVWVSGNLRLKLGFRGQDAIDVDREDDHR